MTGSSDTESLGTHADVLSGSSRVPAPFWQRKWARTLAGYNSSAVFVSIRALDDL